jgi:hypothetical protein
MSIDKANSVKTISLSDDINEAFAKEVLILSSTKKYICCFITEKWCFKHQGLSAYKNYDDNDCLCFEFLDCCSWCLEFKQPRINWVCKEKTICFMCCFSITFQ